MHMRLPRCYVLTLVCIVSVISSTVDPYIVLVEQLVSVISSGIHRLPIVDTVPADSPATFDPSRQPRARGSTWLGDKKSAGAMWGKLRSTGVAKYRVRPIPFGNFQIRQRVHRARVVWQNDYITFPPYLNAPAIARMDSIYNATEIMERKLT